MAHVQHPKYLFKAIARENTPKGDSARPRGLPVVFKLRDVDDTNVQNDGKEALKVVNC